MAIEFLAYVNKASGSEVSVKVISASLEKELLCLGFSFNSDVNEWGKSVDSEQDKAALFDNLRDLNVCFSGGHSWSPAEIFQYLRDKQLLTGEFEEVTWTAPNQPLVRRI